MTQDDTDILQDLFDVAWVDWEDFARLGPTGGRVAFTEYYSRSGVSGELIGAFADLEHCTLGSFFRHHIPLNLEWFAHSYALEIPHETWHYA